MYVHRYIHTAKKASIRLRYLPTSLIEHALRTSLVEDLDDRYLGT
jgi:hypothetical protein